MVYKAIILDFDGVILESVDIKTKAFKELFKEFPDKLGEIVDYHLKNGGISRYKKFSYIYSDILKQKLEKAQLDKLGESFSTIIMQEMISCPYVHGALEFLEEYSKKGRLFIASGTPGDELRYITDKRGISHYFDGIYGTPETKPEILMRILKEHKLGKNDVFFIGDSINDYEGARIAGIPFIARINKDYISNLMQYNLTSVNDLAELASLIKKIQ